jgi:hypothetical protein
MVDIFFISAASSSLKEARSLGLVKSTQLKVPAY